MNIAIILSGGSGNRVGTDIPKQFLKIGNKTIIEYSIEAFENHQDIDEIIIVSNPDYIRKTEHINQNKYKKVLKIIEGGKTRQESSDIGVSSIETKVKNVLIHDAARPFVSIELIDRLLKGLINNKAAVPAVQSSDTLIEKSDSNFVKSIPDRNVIQRVQTPQAFNYNIIKEAHKLAKVEGFYNATDDCSLVLRYKLADVLVVDGSINNIKITYPSDIIYSKELIKNGYKN